MSGQAQAKPVEIPTWREALSWMWERGSGWVAAHPVGTLLVVGGLVIAYVGWVVRRAVQA